MDMQKYLFPMPALGFQCYRSQNVTSEQVGHHLNITGNFENHLGQQGKPNMVTYYFFGTFLTLAMRSVWWSSAMCDEFVRKVYSERCPLEESASPTNSVQDGFASLS